MNTWRAVRLAIAAVILGRRLVVRGSVHHPR